MNIPIGKAWQHCPMCGQKRRNENDSPFLCEGCGHQHYFSPNSAVGALISDPEGQLLWIVRGKEPGKGKLGFPGGFVDAGERVEEAVVREVREEVNLAIHSLQFVASFPNTYEWNGIIYHVTDLFFSAVAENTMDLNCQPEEVSGYRWLNPDCVQPEDLAFESHGFALQSFQSMQKRN